VSEPAAVDRFQIALSLGATFKINGEAWTKPGAETSISWRGIPDQDQVNTAIEFMEKKILEPMMIDVAELAMKYTRQAEGIAE
jgi:hypothetical protein